MADRPDIGPRVRYLRARVEALVHRAADGAAASGVEWAHPALLTELSVVLAELRAAEDELGRGNGGDGGADTAGEARFRALVEHSTDLVAVLDAEGIVRYVSPSIEAVLGHRPEDVVGTRAGAWLPGEEVDATRHNLAKVFDGPRSVAQFESRLLHRNGLSRAFDVVATNLVDEPSVGGIVIDARDISERKEREEQLARQAFCDALTGLPNRALFTDRLAQALSTARRRRDQIAILFLDLDGFKTVNDRLGHGVGDSLLIEVGRRLRTCLRPGDTVARFGGDEFTILAEDVGQPADAVRVAQRVLETLRQPFRIEGRDVFVTASIGIALGNPVESAVRPDELMRAADVALYRAKAEGKARAVVFDPEMNAGALERLDKESDLRRAVESGELRVYHQPEIDLGSGEIVGMEALVRWQHPRRGLLTPADFIGLAEETGLIVPLGQWVLRESCRRVRAWEARYSTGRPLAANVNLSARQVAQPELVAQVAAILEETELEPSRLRLEITESVLLEEGPMTEATLRGLKAFGIQLAIDDFGTGYSSLSYLRRLPVDVLKIDRSFVAGLERDDGGGAIVGAITTLAHALGMNVTAEGIETAEQLARARAIGCRNGQGYYFSRPLPDDAMDAFLGQDTAARWPAMGGGVS